MYYRGGMGGRPGMGMGMGMGMGRGMGMGMQPGMGMGMQPGMGMGMQPGMGMGMQPMGMGMGMQPGMGMGMGMGMQPGMGMGMQPGMGMGMGMQGMPMSTNFEGTLAIQIISAHGLKGEHFRKIDPFVLVESSIHNEKTKTCKNGGTTPSWNQSVSIKVKDGDALKFTVKDDDMINNDELGSASLSQVQYSLGYEGELPLMNKHKKPAGTLRVIVRRQM